ncbi:MAG: YdcF family protein [Gammaproteobacteria bacterium]|nr:YdcF family protein [Gammaproteobacteria bacterium]
MSRNALRHADRFDWDGLQMLMLTGLLLIVSAGLLILPGFVHVYRTARKANDNAPAGSECLVFGKRSTNGQIDVEYRMRLAKAAELFRQQPRTLILLGGHTTPDGPSEAEMGLRELRRIGLSVNAPIRLEEQSLHTLENLRNARDIHQRHPVLISNRYHLARCSLIAESLGMDHSLCAAEPILPGGPMTYIKLIKESFYILWFQVGKSWARLTNNRRMLDRIT